MLSVWFPGNAKWSEDGHFHLVHCHNDDVNQSNYSSLAIRSLRRQNYRLSSCQAMMFPTDWTRWSCYCCCHLVAALPRSTNALVTLGRWFVYFVWTPASAEVETKMKDQQVYHYITGQASAWFKWWRLAKTVKTNLSIQFFPTSSDVVIDGIIVLTIM